MRNSRSLFCLFAAISVAFAPAASALELGVPADLAAKRAGKLKAATPSPLNMIFTPITPCRAFGKQDLPSRTPRVFQISGAEDLTPQGGPANGCGIPSTAKAVAINLSAASGAAGAMFANASGTPNNLLASVSYRPGTVDTAGSIVALSPEGKITAWTSTSSRVYGDVTGYFEPQLWAYVAPDGQLIDSSGQVESVTRNGIGDYSVKFKRTVDSCVAVASADLAPKLTAAYAAGDTVTVHIATVLQLLPQDYHFNLMVKC